MTAHAPSGFAALLRGWTRLALVEGCGPAPVVEALGERGPRSALTQCRAVVTLAHVGRLAGDPELIAAALRVQGFVAAHMMDGGVIATVAEDGAPQDTRRRSYDQCFALLALAELNALDPVATPETQLEALWGFVEAELLDSTGVLRDDDGPETGRRAQNPQMHMLEALLAAYQATGNEVWLTRAEQRIAIAERHFIDPATGAVREFIGADLHPLPGPEGARREPGHQYEWAWLLHRYADLAGDDAPRHLARRMQQFADTHGVRRGGPLDGAPFDALDAEGRVTEDTHLLWPLTEAGKLYARLGDPAAQRMAELIFTRYFTPGALRWVNQLDGDGTVTWDAALSRLLYHVAYFVTEGDRAGLWRLTGPDGQPGAQDHIAPSPIKEEETPCN